MLQSFHIENFRGFERLDLEELGTVNLLVGANSTGKTSVLEALAIFAAPGAASTWVDIPWDREIKMSRASLLESILWLFHEGRESEARRLRLSAIGEDGPVRVEAVASERERLSAAGDDGPHSDSGSDELPESMERGLEIEVERRNRPSDQFLDRIETDRLTVWERGRLDRPVANRIPTIPCRLLGPYTHRLHMSDPSLLSESVLEGSKDRLLDLLRTFDPEVRDLVLVERRGARAAVYVDHARMPRPSPASIFGDGFRRSLHLALVLVAGRLNGGLLLLDEIESSMHPEMLSRVFGWLCEIARRERIQIFATTHSLEAIDAMLGDDPGGDVTVHRLRRFDDGSIRSSRFAGELLHDLRVERGLEIR